MTRIEVAIGAFIAVIILSGCDKRGVEEQKEVKLVTTTDTISYLIGNDIARSMKNIKDEIVLEIVFAGIRDQLEGKPPRFTAEQERFLLDAFGMKMEQKKMAQTEAEAKANLDAAKKFLEENGKKPGVVTTPSGLQYIVLKQGDGPFPTDSSKVKVHYEGTLLDGTVFDSSIRRGQPANFRLTDLISGWREGLKLMRVGSKYRLFIPPDLAYGRRGMMHDIRPNMMLIFEVELLGIEQ